MADVIFNSFREELAEGVHDFENGSYKVMLTTNSYTPNASTHSKRSDVTNEVVGTGYTAGGQAVVSLTATESAGVVTVDITDPNWASSTITARYMILYQDVGTAATDRLVMAYDFGSDESSSNGDFTVQINASGLFDIS